MKTSNVLFYYYKLWKHFLMLFGIYKSSNEKKDISKNSNFFFRKTLSSDLAQCLWRHWQAWHCKKYLFKILHFNFFWKKQKGTIWRSKIKRSELIKRSKINFCFVLGHFQDKWENYNSSSNFRSVINWQYLFYKAIV